MTSGDHQRSGGEERGWTEQDLVRWSEALAGIARTGLGFTESQYERERYEEVLAVAADMRVAAGMPYDAERVLELYETAGFADPERVGAMTCLDRAPSGS